MKKIPTLLLLLFAVNTAIAQYPLDSVLTQLDLSINDSEKYAQHRESRIKSLREKLQEAKTNWVYCHNINMKLYDEYKSYVCDSAIFYLNQCIKLSQQLGDNNRLYDNKLKLAFLMASTGMYLEAVDMLFEIKRNQLPEYLIKDYYNTNLHVYGELSHYTQNKEIALRYRKIANDFRDSLFHYLPVDDALLLSLQESNFLYNNKLAEARKINDIRLSKVKIGASGYAVVAWQRALICQRGGDTEGGKYYLALSAISDIRFATKDHASLWMLAQILYKENDISRAYNYIRFSWSETVFYNARLRNLQSAVILALIDKTYQAAIEKQKSTHQTYLILISALSVLLVAALIYIYRQMKRLLVARKNLQSVNEQLKVLNEELKEMNNRLQSMNLELQESNRIKEVYIGHFIKLCSTYIEKLNEFRRMVNRKIDSGKTTELLRYTRSPDALSDVFQEFYANFDTVFLRIFPDFVEKVNELFYYDDKIILKEGELLNTELRILALVRLGIHTSSQIADFLRYSANTIYNYRAKVKNRAVFRDDFEDKIMQIR
jgi:hypothetical protein